MFFRILDNRIDQVLAVSRDGEISTYKSTLSFKHIISVNVDEDKIEVITAFGKYRYEHIMPMVLPDDAFEEFHRVLVSKFDAYCDRNNHFR